MQPDSPRPDPEVPAKAQRRRFSAAEKARILAEYEAGTPIERAALCRRERIYTSHICMWRKQRDAGEPLDAKRGRKPNPEALEAGRLRRENEQLQKRLAKAERVIEIQGKVYALLRAVAGESADQMDLPPWQNKP